MIDLRGIVLLAARALQAHQPLEVASRSRDEGPSGIATELGDGGPTLAEGPPGRGRADPPLACRPILRPLRAWGKNEDDDDTMLAGRRCPARPGESECVKYITGWSEYLYIVCLGKTVAAHFGSSPP